VAAHPDDVEARVSLARALLQKNDMMGAFEETRAVLQRSPDEPRALTYQAVVRLAMGQSEMAETMLKRAIAARPDLGDAHVYLMLVYTETGRDADADAALNEAARRVPDHREAFRELLARMRREVAERGGPQTAQTGENPHAGLEAASGAGAAGGMGGAVGGERGMGGGSAGSAVGPGPAPVATGAAISGTVDLDPSVRGSVAQGAVIYVLLRSAGETAGPPAAVTRLAAGTFPVPFSIGAAHSMTGGDVPDPALLEARLDRDGDAATRAADEPVGRIDGVRLGARDVRIVLAVKR
jgi:cytochrome c-type biogenesis protein CcmH